jgi:hypothetical protein
MARYNSLSPQGQSKCTQNCQDNKRQDEEHKKEQFQIREGVSGALQAVFAIDPFLCPTGSLRHHGFITSPISY